MKIRNASVEGRFYPATKNQVFDQIQEIENTGRYSLAELSPERLFGGVLPHAGHIYSGHQTIPFFQMIRNLNLYPETFVIVHPNHSGTGAPLAIDDADVWQNSMGEIPLDRELARALLLPFDPLAHAYEHSAEVIIPFLQYYLPDHPFSIVPISMTDQRHKTALLVAERISGAVEATGRSIMVLASCDFSHFLPPLEGRKKDQLVVDEILARNPKGIERAVNEHHISICGYGPVMVLMEYAHALNAGYKIQILARGHSGEVSASRDVVNYISMIMYQ